MKNTCKTCAHWHPWNGYLVATGDWHTGDCRFNPPQLVTLDTLGGDAEVEHTERWPDMSPDQWCGQYQPKSEADLKSDDHRLRNLKAGGIAA